MSGIGRSRFWIGIAGLALVFVGACVAMLGGMTLGATIVAIVAGQALVAEAFGTRVTAAAVAFPWRPVPWFPVLPLWRTWLPLEEVQHLTGLKPVVGIERVKLRTKDMRHEMLLFSRRDDKVAFFSALSAAVPTLSIYRSNRGAAADISG